MKPGNLILKLLALVALVNICQLSDSYAQGTAFSYQGQLTSGGSPVEGSYDLQFALYDTNAGGCAVAGPITNLATAISNGLFCACVDFGPGVFNGTPCWLDVAVRTNGASTFVELTPRQFLTATPYASYAASVPGLVVQTNANGSPNVIAGSGSNYVSGAWGATISGGGAPTSPNSVSANFGTVGGGDNNTASGANATVGGGINNTATNSDATVAGGINNTASANYATAGGGNNNTASGGSATVGGGYYNRASGGSATVGGGYYNKASGGSATVAGGNNNTAGGGSANVGGGLGNNAGGDISTVAGGYTNSASGIEATVGGGAQNTASGTWATIPGGSQNVASGLDSFAAGQQAQALHQGAFVWADSQNTLFASTNNDSFNVRAQGGVNFVTGTNSISLNGQPFASASAAGISLSGVLASWQTVSGTSQIAAPNASYLLTNNELDMLTLPSSPPVGAIVTVSGSGSNGWQAGVRVGEIIAGAQEPAGAVWTEQTSAPTSASWDCVASSADGSHLVAGDKGGIYTSTDFGTNWTQQTSAPSDSWTCVVSSSDGKHLAAVAWDDGIYTSTDFGTNWTKQPNAPSDWSWIASSSDGSHLVAMVNGGGVYTSINFGTNWTKQPNAPSDLWYSVASSSDGSHLVAVVEEASGIYTSINFGTNWTEQANSPSFGWLTVVSSADGSHLAAVVFQGGIYTSSNFGTNWTQLTNAPPANWNGIASSADGSHLVAVANPGVIYTSTDFGTQWTQQTSAPTSAYWNRVASSADGSHLVAVVSDGGIYTSVTTQLPFAGEMGTAAQFQYIGNGVWQPLGLPLAELPAVVVTNFESGVTLSGTFNSSSDRNVKQNFRPIAGPEILNKVAQLPLSQWSYKSDPVTRHIGPMAQDFKAAFNVGPDDKHIALMDESGVALAAIQGLNEKLKEKDAEITELKARLEKLERLVSTLEN